MCGEINDDGLPRSVMDITDAHVCVKVAGTLVEVVVVIVLLTPAVHLPFSVSPESLLNLFFQV